MANEELTINEAFDKLETILKEMENPELSLEKSFEKYNEGLNLVKYCNSSIDKIEQKLTVLECE